jgi:V/A-type H+-transporting ATPase subunit F
MIIGDRYTVSLFQMAGVEGRVVSSPDELMKTLTETRKREDIDVVLITKDFYDIKQSAIDEMSLQVSKPIITVIPSPFVQSTPVDVKKLIAKALGFG